mmetsp:Transcript_4036/g.13953  ORF Transcript_4036/g.13953 Transcript_4036/m.13953 type:complete len:216 (+) Transcript_4036:865-1512(+)
MRRVCGEPLERGPIRSQHATRERAAARAAPVRHRCVLPSEFRERRNLKRKHNSNTLQATGDSPSQYRAVELSVFIYLFTPVTARAERGARAASGWRRTHRSLCTLNVDVCSCSRRRERTLPNVRAHARKPYAPDSAYGWPRIWASRKAAAVASATASSSAAQSSRAVCSMSAASARWTPQPPPPRTAHTSPAALSPSERALPAARRSAAEQSATR